MDCSLPLDQAGSLAQGVHGEGFQLYPHIHGTGSTAEQLACDSPLSSYYPHIYNLQRPDMGVTATQSKPRSTPIKAQLLQAIAANKIQSQALSSPSAPPPLHDAVPITIPKDLPVKNAGSLTSEQLASVKRSLLQREADKNKATPKTQEASTSTAAPVVSTATTGGTAGSATTCLKPGVCGKCVKHGSSCSKTVGCAKTAERHFAAMARMGFSTNPNSRGAIKFGVAKDADCSQKGTRNHMCPKPKAGHDPVKKLCCGEGEGLLGIRLPDIDDSSSPEDSCSERSNSTSSTQKDARHCDCCYCEVFGHGVPAVAPVSRNYQEMRERLRLRLNMKKSAKCKTVQPAPGQQQNAKELAATPSTGNAIQDQKEEDLDSLLKYIEGNMKDECTDEKKAAKRARQKQKKQDEKDRLEEEEAERQRLEAMKRQVSISLVNGSKKSHKNQHRSQAAHQSQQHQGKSGGNLVGLKTLMKPNPEAIPKMVTIRRVMEPYGAEPTVTITLKGSTPDKDKVLFTLKNSAGETVQQEVQPDENANEKLSKKQRKKKAKEELLLREMEMEFEEELVEEVEEVVPNKKKKKNKKKAEDAPEPQPVAETRPKPSQTKQQPVEAQNSSKASGKTKNSKQPQATSSVPVSQQKNTQVLKSQTQINKPADSKTGKPQPKAVPVKPSPSVQTKTNVPAKPASIQPVKATQKNAKPEKVVNGAAAKATKPPQQPVKVQPKPATPPVQIKKQPVEVKPPKKPQPYQQQPYHQQTYQNQQVCHQQPYYQQQRMQPPLRPTQVIEVSSLQQRNVKDPRDSPSNRKDQTVINTPSYRLSEVLSSIASTQAPPKEDISLENLRLPPGITITKIEGPVNKTVRASSTVGHVSKPVPMAPPIVLATPSLKTKPTAPPGNVIVVDTGRLKEVMKENQSSLMNGTPGKKKKKKKKAEPIVGLGSQGQIGGRPSEEGRPMMGGLHPEQATIIKTSDNMVTIRSPALQQAMNMHAYHTGQPINGMTVNGYSSMKDRMDSDDSLSRQMRRLNLREGTEFGEYTQSVTGLDKSKKKKNKKKKQGYGCGDGREFDPLESVFQPKDIDLENGDIDDDERELEAFKRFCLQSVPPERKEKVKVNLNIKDIVLKKKSSAIGCS